MSIESRLDLIALIANSNTLQTLPHCFSQKSSTSPPGEGGKLALSPPVYPLRSEHRFVQKPFLPPRVSIAARHDVFFEKLSRKKLCSSSPPLPPPSVVSFFDSRHFGHVEAHLHPSRSRETFHHGFFDKGEGEEGEGGLRGCANKSPPWETVYPSEKALKARFKARGQRICRAIGSEKWSEIVSLCKLEGETDIKRRSRSRFHSSLSRVVTPLFFFFSFFLALVWLIFDK